MNLFIEGLQGSGKSTLVQMLADAEPNYKVLREGDYSPVELAWCTYMSREAYESALKKYASLRSEIEERSVSEGDRMIIPYTRIRTDIPGFYQDMEQYEIYNGRICLEELRRIVLGRFSAWNGQNQSFECSLLQNLVEEMLLYCVMTDDEILAFYQSVYDVLKRKDYRILYLKTEDIPQSIDHIRKERTDAAGHEVWFHMLLEYFHASPYAKTNNVSGPDALFRHFQHRQALELRICREIFGKYALVLPSKSFDRSSLFSMTKGFVPHDNASPSN